MDDGGGFDDIHDYGHESHHDNNPHNHADDGSHHDNNSYGSNHHDNSHHNPADDGAHGRDWEGHQKNSFDDFLNEHGHDYHEEEIDRHDKSKNNPFGKLYDRAKRNYNNSTPEMKFVKATALVGSAIIAISAIKNLITINADKSGDKEQNKKKTWKEIGKIGVAAAITYFSVLRGNGKAISGGK